MPINMSAGINKLVYQDAFTCNIRSITNGLKSIAISAVLVVRSARSCGASVGNRAFFGEFSGDSAETFCLAGRSL